ncbi:helix-turn-helix domain-containing protein [Pseudomonas sp. JM0905a]|uniref:helix-turn-helix domain-containing protein n=1 Tax=Pseudomonas sp. JM0905a TaxID=2772484 RepID=UPI001689A6FA|nr:helix-turn-helix transcriptional regulator [Pseudomonas sp. JM0905a]MBD2838992.1 helix-turn-helix domain-containing protein [Pseudomonas sp. JM0905a]
MSESEQQRVAVLVGRAVARQRQQANLTQEEVAERLEIGSEAVSRIERGVVIPNIARLFELAEIFGCEAADLLMESSTRPEDQAVQISRMLSMLEASDRKLVLDFVERLSLRLSQS